MGNQVFVGLRRSWRNWNVENRAQRKLEQLTQGRARVQAPLHPSSEEAVAEMRQATDIKQLTRKDESLHERLKLVVLAICSLFYKCCVLLVYILHCHWQLNVESHEPQSRQRATISGRHMTSVQLAAARNAQIHQGTGYPEPAKRISLGSISLREALHLLGKPSETRLELAQQMGLEREQAEALLRYCRLFHLENEEGMLRKHEQLQQQQLKHGTTSVAPRLEQSQGQNTAKATTEVR